MVNEDPPWGHRVRPVLGRYAPCQPHRVLGIDPSDSQVGEAGNDRLRTRTSRSRRTWMGMPCNAFLSPQGHWGVGPRTAPNTGADPAVGLQVGPNRRKLRSRMYVRRVLVAELGPQDPADRGGGALRGSRRSATASPRIHPPPGHAGRTRADRVPTRRTRRQRQSLIEAINELGGCNLYLPPERVRRWLLDPLSGPRTRMPRSLAAERAASAASWINWYSEKLDRPGPLGTAPSPHHRRRPRLLSFRCSFKQIPAQGFTA